MILRIIVLCMCFSTPGFATFSIVAVDTATGEVGGAGASCIANSRIINDLIVGLGAIHTQSYYLPGNQQYAHALMLAGVPPDDIVDSLEANDVFDDPTIRQYGIVDLVNGGRFAAYTGVNCTDWAGHRVGSNYAIQGNILLSEHIVDTMEWAFLNTTGRLDERLMAALEAAKIPGADTRCLSSNKSAISAFIRVVRPRESLNDAYCDLNVPNTTGSTEPIDLLRDQYDEWLEEIRTSADPIYSEVTVGRTLINAGGDTTIVLIRLVNNRGEPLDETAEPDAWTSAGASFTIPEYIGDGNWVMILTSLPLFISDTITVINYSGARPGELYTRPVVVYDELSSRADPLPPSDASLLQAYPSPFNSRVTIDLDASIQGLVSLRIFDLKGRLVTTLAEGTRSTAQNSYVWSPRSAATGLYFVRLESEQRRITRKVLYLK